MNYVDATHPLTRMTLVNRFWPLTARGEERIYQLAYRCPVCAARFTRPEKGNEDEPDPVCEGEPS